MATLVASLCLPAVAAAGTFTWNMPADFTATGTGSNPDHDRYGAQPWTYAEGKFTFGDLLRHLAAIERWMFTENAQGKPSMYPGHGRECRRLWEEMDERRGD